MGGGLGPGDIHNAVTAGPGTGSTQDAQRASAALAKTHLDRITDVAALKASLGSAWSGDASEAAQSGTGPLEDYLKTAQTALSTHQDLLSRQTDSFHVANNSVHDIPNDPPSASVMDVLSDASGVSLITGGGYMNKVQDWSDKAHANVAAYNSYANASTYNHNGLPTDYGTPGGSTSDIALAPTQTQTGDTGVDGPGGSGRHVVPNTGGGPGAPGWSPSLGGGAGGVAGGGSGPGGSGGPGTPGYPGGGGSTNTQGWPGGQSYPGGGGLNPPGGGSGSGLGPGSGGVDGFGGAFGPLGSGGAGASAGGAGARGFRSGAGGVGGTGSSGGQAGAGNRAGVGGVGEGGPGAAAAAGRPGAAGAAGASGMAGGGAGRGGRKEEDREHKSAAYLEDDYSDELVGKLPPTVPPVIGMD
ncbi:WXG100 family type VII secretion target [Kutzneria sp. NPDC052558]|uniref:WXG100 family type VII secretion target n=1 Tax=Kutzneria sp. NPDC052558 TaxID=3364121 RepID=UPI0037C70828